MEIQVLVSSGNRLEKCSRVSSTLPQMKITWVLVAGPNSLHSQPKAGQTVQTAEMNEAGLACLAYQLEIVS